jgi:hypothetical protein
MSAAKTSPFPWKGELTRPIVRTGPRSRNLTPTAAMTEPPTTEEQERHARRYDAASREAYRESLRKLELVKEQLKIPRGEGENLVLALALATIYVPGFRVIYQGQGRGRKRTKWTDFRCLALVVEVGAEKVRLGTDEDKEAVREIVRRKNHYVEYDKKNPMPRMEDAIASAAASLNSRLVEARQRTSAEAFRPFLWGASRLAETSGCGN